MTAKMPSRARRLARQAERMARARSAVKPGSRPADYQTGLARTAALPVLPAGLPADEYVSVAEGALLIGTSYQNLFQVIGRGECPAYQHKGRRVCLVTDLVETQAARMQAEQVAEEAHRQGWLSAHVSGDSCIGRGCQFWAHEPVKRPASPAQLAHLALIRVKAKVTNEAKRAAQLADIAAVQARLAAEQAAGEETRQ